MKKIWALILASGVMGIQSLSAAETFRTDINPALLYHQGFALRPELSQADHDYLFTNEWRGRVLDDRFLALIPTYKNSFKLFRRAAKAQVPCDWGLDLSDGPNALLPGLAKAKLAAQTARLRVMWHLQNGLPDEARDDLLAALVLGRQLPTDRVLISTLVQFAIENIVASIIAENFYQLPPDTLAEIAAGLESAPGQGLVAECIDTEKKSFSEYYLRKIAELRAEDESRALARVRELLARTLDDEDAAADGWVAKAERIMAAAGGTLDGLVRLFQELAPLYEQVERIMRLPPAEYQKAMTDFVSMVKAHPNPLVNEFFMVFDSCRKKEFGTQSTVAMVHAAVAYKVRGDEGFRAVLDPCSGVPFEFERFVFEGVDRGFKLKSKFRSRDFDEVLIFVEKPGPLFRTTGKTAGQKVK